ncbi:MAG: hemerythrin domain-containing protein [Anaerolineae bacterium]
MANPSAPSVLAQTFLYLHHAITRGLTVSLERGAAFREAPPGDPVLRQGYVDYVTAFTIVVNAHHAGEDWVAFPALRAVIPDAPYDRLMADHQAIVGLLGAVRDAVTQYGEGRDAALPELLDALGRLRRMWERHIPIEEEHFSAAALNAVLSGEEQARLEGVWAEHSQGLATPPWLAVPFVLYDLEPAERAGMAARFPPAVVQELLPVVWADQWRAMRPFLLLE